MTSYTFHITLYDLIIFGMIFTGWVFCLFLWFVKSINRSANRFLALALLAMTLWMLRILHINLPAQMLLAVGPLLYFYVLKITQREHQFKRKDLLHLSPLAFVVAPVPILQILIFTSVIVYLYLANRLIQKFYKGLQPVLMDRSLLEFRWLRRLLGATALLWVLWIVSESGLPVYGSVYIFFAVMVIWTAAAAFLRPHARLTVQPALVPKPLPPIEIKGKATWLKKAMEANRYYLDPELSLSSLAEKLGMQPHELSRIVNAGLKKNFNDFINEYRIRSVTRKMKDPAYDRLTLLGIAFESGFNSRTTFHRTFKQLTGKSPAEFKAGLKKEIPYYDLEHTSPPAAVISCHEAIPVWFYGQLNRNYMFRNYLKIAWRNLVNNKIYSGLNILGLAAGMAVALLIGLWVVNEYSYDRFLPDYETLYQVKRNFTNNGEIGTVTSSSLALADRLRTDVPEIANVAETDYFNAHGLMVGDKKLYMNGGQVGSDFLKMFRFSLLQGVAEHALKDPFSIVLTEATAQALFGTENAIGKTVRIDNLNDLKVTGILKDIPSNSSFQFAYLVPFSYYEIADPTVKANRSLGFNQNSFQVFVKLRPGITYAQVEPKIRGLEKKYLPGANTDIAMQPLKDWHLYTEYQNGQAVGGFIEYVRIFSIVGALVLVIACINFVNLTTARSEKRAREVGVRKTMGSSRKDLIFQFLVESVFTTVISFAFCLLFARLALPFFNSLTNEHISIPFSIPGFWLLMTAAVFATGLLAGSRPAFYLSSFNPVKVLKGIKTGKAAAFSRQALVVLQFSCSIALIIGTIIIYRQVQYAQNRPIGYNLSLLLQTNLDQDLDNHYNALRNDLLNSGIVQSAASASSPATGIFWHTGITWPGQLPGETINIGTIKVTPGYFKTMGMELAGGHDFSGNHAADSLSVVLNEAAVKRLRFKDPLSETITWNNNKLRIIGVVKNALLESPYANAEPTMFMSGGGSFFLYRLSPNVSLTQAVSRLTTIFNSYNPAFPYSYQFADQEYAAKFGLELLIGKLAGVFAGLAIFISCLGLFGLAAYVAEQRLKEISIRKVLGASIFQMWAMLSKDFIVLVVISCLVASPLAFFFLRDWLQKYSYRVSIGPGVFLIAGILAIIVTLVTVSFQAIKAALANPVKSLRSE
ncbi:MAG TPA: ABC transporter permease [Mucilaginibacter sp.]|nr:ABC transporter permease [Mucilaginibacter sp.]